LLWGELVYTGVRRTPICAVLGMEVAAEFFATMHDAYLVAGLTAEDPADRDTADGRPATRSFARARLARMRCADINETSEAETRTFAERALTAQWDAVIQAIERVLHGRPAVERVVVSGSGEILGLKVRERLPRLADLAATSWAKDVGPKCPECSAAACAFAVAMLAAQGTHDV
jgi:(4-(4-[2-(gamma-L-glutamylamino)ethyl]phenoxymethyl)furan-2-yl)methanamine synthase